MPEDWGGNLGAAQRAPQELHVSDLPQNSLRSLTLWGGPGRKQRGKSRRNGSGFSVSAALSDEALRAQRGEVTCS